MENPMQFYISSFEGKIKQAMKKFDSTESWNVCYNINLQFTIKW